MKLERIYKYQLFLYIFIIIFGIQNYYFNKYNFNWSFYENLLLFIFLLSVATVLGSLILLTYESIKTINRKETDVNEIIYLITNLFLFYLVIWISLYLSTQARL